MEWTLNRIKQLLESKVQESLNLEYKALAALSNAKELAKDVSSFANSDGGIIIYGIKEKNHIPIEIDSDATKYLNAETIEQILSSHINPKISNLKIHSVSNQNNCNTLFVIEIVRSDLAPHMAKDNRYYKRYNLKSAPMEHYEIEDIRNRLISPNIEIILNKAEFKLENTMYESDFSVVNVNRNNSLILYYSLQICIPKNWELNLRPWDFVEDIEIQKNVNGITETYKSWYKNFLPPRMMPLWKNKQFLLGKVLKAKIPPSDLKPIYFIVSCPHASDKTMEWVPEVQKNIISWRQI